MNLEKLAEKAAELLGIDFVVVRKRAYHYAKETGHWHRVTIDALRYAKDAKREYPHDAYSHWCAGTSAKMMPRGWEPQA